MGKRNGSNGNSNGDHDELMDYPAQASESEHPGTTEATDEMFDPPQFLIQDELLMLVKLLQDAESMAVSLGLREVIHPKAVLAIAKAKDHVVKRYVTINDVAVLAPILKQFGTNEQTPE